MHYHKQPSPDCLAAISDLASGEGSSESKTLTLENEDHVVTVSCLQSENSPGCGAFHLKFNRKNHPLPHTTPALACDAIMPLSCKSNADESDDQSVIIDAGRSTLQFKIDSDQAIGLTYKANGTEFDLIPLDRTQRIGFNGDKFGIGLRMPAGTPYYGFGEKTGPLNKNGQRMKFWNVDVCADHPYGCGRDDYDPAYCAIPLAIWRSEATDEQTGKKVYAYAAVLIDNGGPAFFNCDTNDFLEERFFYFGTYVGEPSFYFLTGTSMADICKQVIALTGKTSLPPIWALGNQQCRWGYDSEKQYKSIMQSYIDYDIPLSGFWLDIDYMDRYRVFEWHPQRVPDPRGLCDWMHERNVRLITIIDPGVAAVEGNELYDEGQDSRLFCQAPSGKEFIGMVWPGKTAFPDFSLDETCQWWADHLADHLALGVDGIWNDMNDPATGWCEVDDMLFQHGSIDHAHYHNLYGTMMAKATSLGFQQADPTTRPFVLTRSASTGIQQYSAVWTGDNASNWGHLCMSIPETLNLSLSGVSFNGPDVGGFMDNTNAELLTRWYQAAILFPFYRNHANNATAHQEPWCFGTGVRENIRRTIILRYRLLAYLYTCFGTHIETGEPMLRPLCYASPDDLYKDVQDEYMVGDCLVVAPIVHEGARKRFIILPPANSNGGRWFDCSAGVWRTSGSFFERAVSGDDIPIFVRDGSIIFEPIPDTLNEQGEPTFCQWDGDLTNVRWRVHVFASDQASRATGRQLIDDGRSKHANDAPMPMFDLQLDLAPGQLEGSFPVERIDSLIIHGRDETAIASETLESRNGTSIHWQRQTIDDSTSDDLLNRARLCLPGISSERPIVFGAL